MITKRGRRWLRRGVVTTILLVVFVVAAATWFHSESIESTLFAVEPWVPELDLEVVAVDEGRVTLSRTDAVARDGVWGLEWAGGYAVLGDVIDGDGATVTRLVSFRDGEPPVGDPAALDPFAVPTDPNDVGVDFREVVFDGPLGRYPAWETSGLDDTWVVFIHDKGTNRREALRLLPTVADMGFSTFVISYRNDPEAPEGGRRYDLGDSEWEDVEGAVLHVLGSGAQDVVLVGYGMGATMASLFLHRSAWADRVQGMVFDAPLIDPGRVVDAESERRNIPGALTGLAKAFADMRFGVEWNVLDQVRRADEFAVPILVLHGEADEIAPVGGSRAFADALPGLVTLEMFEDAGHFESWNVDPDRYEEAVRAFLADVALGRSDLDVIVPEGSGGL
jgi:pimeloyl-ACP methyl ester carboxylesterase